MNVLTMRLFTTLAVLFSFSFSHAQQIRKTPLPSWVDELKISNFELAKDPGGFQYLLYDKQVNLVKGETYWRTAYQVLNAEGIQSMSDITMDFDPAYESLEVHDLVLIRDGKTIDYLDQVEIHSYQREQGLERALYDGSVTAVINLHDVRKNDIIRYSYSIKGRNPILKGNYTAVNYLQFGFPANRLHYRFIVPDSKKLTYALFQGAADPAVTDSPGSTEYVWNVESLDYVSYDTNVPSWYDPRPRAEVSTYSSWKEVVDWALPLFDYSGQDLSHVKELGKQAYIKELMPLPLIRMVQDEIRYLGFENGISAYKPHSPDKVARQRYGDCKDKSLLLVALLRDAGYEAYPVLVDTDKTRRLTEILPNSQAFNHCIVNFRINGQSYFVDPTIAHQGGDLAHWSVPDYAYGLVIKPGETGLSEIIQGDVPTISVNELFTVLEVGDTAALVIRTEYTGNQADRIRGYFASESRKSVQDSYTQFYRSLYPGIVESDSIRFYDYDRYSTNKVITEEYYQVPDFWTFNEDSTQFNCEIYPLVLDNITNYDQSTDRTMPYYLGNPYAYSQLSRVELPEPWNVTLTQQSVDGNGFSYSNSMEQEGPSTVMVRHNYRLDKSYAPAGEVAGFLAKNTDMRSHMSYLLFKPVGKDISVASGTRINILLVLLAFALSIFFAVLLYRRYDPVPWEYAENKPIGGFLILPAIGVVVSPLYMGYQLISGQYLNPAMWSGFSTGLSLLAAAEILVNIAMLVLSVLVLILFFQRRTSLPRLITFAYLIYVIVPLVDNMLAASLLGGDPAQLSETLSSSLSRILAAIIWIPVFNVSERVKSTFCLQYGERRPKTRYLSDRIRMAESGPSDPEENDIS